MGIGAFGAGSALLYNSTQPGNSKRQNLLSTPQQSKASPDQQLMQSLIDTIIPADEFAGGLDLNLDKQLAAKMQQEPKTQELMNRIYNYIKDATLTQFRAGFSDLDIDQRENLLLQMLKKDSNPSRRSDLRQFRNTLLGWYYDSPEGHKSLGYLLPGHYPLHPG